MAEVLLRKLRKVFGVTEVIKDIDLEIEDNELTVLVGPSGCGKSTLLRLIAGLEDVTAGEILIDGQVVNDLPPAQRGIAMVFQSYALYPHMTVYENMAFGLKMTKCGKAAIDERVHWAARLLQIESLLRRKPRELSGGQRQRVAIGRAIVRKPKVFLFDEPLSNLDAALRVQMRIEISRLQTDLKATMIYVTHDQTEAMTLGHKIVVLNNGRLEQAGPPLELYHRPANLFVAGFIGSPKMNFLQGAVIAVGKDSVTVNLQEKAINIPVTPNQAKTGDAVILGIRPEHMNESGTGEVNLSARVAVIERLGGETYLYADPGNDQLIIVKAAASTSTNIGDNITIGMNGADFHLFNRNGKALQG